MDNSKLRVWEWDDRIWVAAETEAEAKEVFEDELGELDYEMGDEPFTELKLTNTIEYSFNICGDGGIYSGEEDGGSQVFTFSELINFHADRGVTFPSIIARSC